MFKSRMVNTMVIVCTCEQPSCFPRQSRLLNSINYLFTCCHVKHTPHFMFHPIIPILSYNDELLRPASADRTARCQGQVVQVNVA